MVSLQVSYYSINSKLNTWYITIQYSRRVRPEHSDLSVIFISSYVLLRISTLLVFSIIPRQGSILWFFFFFFYMFLLFSLLVSIVFEFYCPFKTDMAIEKKLLIIKGSICHRHFRQSHVALPAQGNAFFLKFISFESRLTSKN
jgi:hypothetical protein